MRTAIPADHWSAGAILPGDPWNGAGLQSSLTSLRQPFWRHAVIVEKAWCNLQANGIETNFLKFRIWPLQRLCRSWVRTPSHHPTPSRWVYIFPCPSGVLLAVSTTCKHGFKTNMTSQLQSKPHGMASTPLLHNLEFLWIESFQTLLWLRCSAAWPQVLLSMLSCCSTKNNIDSQVHGDKHDFFFCSHAGNLQWTRRSVRKKIHEVYTKLKRQILGRWFIIRVPSRHVGPLDLLRASDRSPSSPKQKPILLKQTAWERRIFLA